MRLVVAVLLAASSVAVADRVAEVAQTPLPRPPPPPLPQWRPPVEVAKLAHDVEGKWTCKGVTLLGNGASHPVVAALSTKLELDGAWLAVHLDGESKLVAYRTYDPVAKQWTRIQLDSTTSHSESTSLGEKGGLWTWTGTTTTAAGSFESRDYEQRDGKSWKLWGEHMLGGRWQKMYEVTCTK